MPDVDNLSIPMGGGAGERLPVWIRTRPSARVPDLDRNIAQSQAQMAIALWLITLAFGPASIRNRWFESSSLQWLDADQQTQIMKDTGCAIGPTSVAMLVLAGWLPHGGDLILAPHTPHASRDIGRS